MSRHLPSLVSEFVLSQNFIISCFSSKNDYRGKAPFSLPKRSRKINIYNNNNNNNNNNKIFVLSWTMWKAPFSITYNYYNNNYTNKK